MLKQRPLYCPNLFLLDSGKELNFPNNEFVGVIDKLLTISDLVVVFIDNEFVNLTDLQIVIKNNDYEIYQKKSNSDNWLTSQLAGSGTIHSYYIKAESNMQRSAFVHFYDLLAVPYPMVCISKILVTQVQAATIIVPDGITDAERNEFSSQILQPNALLTSSELLMRDLKILGKTTI